MPQNTQQLRTKVLTAIMASVIGLGFVTAAIAARLGVDTDTRIEAGANLGASDHANAGGNADAYMSTAGSANNDAPWGSGVARGTDRAAQRKHSSSAVWPEARQQ